jgi:hypothetical protein
MNTKADTAEFAGTGVASDVKALQHLSEFREQSLLDVVVSHHGQPVPHEATQAPHNPRPVLRSRPSGGRRHASSRGRGLGSQS